jgi:tetratricopeptide (TPR) repeat protein
LEIASGEAGKIIAMTNGEKTKTARKLCEKAAWPELLKFTQDWHAENPRDAKALFYRGAALAATGRFVEAEKIYRLSLEKDPSDFKAWNNLAGILFESLERPMDAVRCMEQAMRLEPQNKLGWSNLASMVGRLGRHEKALEFADRALALDPKMVEALLHKAAAAKALGRTELVREASLTLAAIEAEKFQRAR